MSRGVYIPCWMVLLASGCAGEEPQGRTGDTLRTQITLTTIERPCLGKPINLDLGLVNNGRVPVNIVFSEVGINNSLVVTGPDGKPVPYISGHWEVGVSNGNTAQDLNPGLSQNIAWGVDLGEQYLIDKPGRYVVRYEGKGLLIDDKPAKVGPSRFPS